MKKLIPILLFSQICFSQESTEKPQRYLGIGYKLGAFQTSDLYSNFTPVSRLMVNVDASKYIRLDAQWGASKSETEQFYSIGSYIPTKYSLESKSTVIQFGAFGKYDFDDMLMYLGFRYGFSKASNESIYTDWSQSNPVTSKVKDEENGRIFSPVLGAEYRFGNRFSVGAEISYLIINSESKPGAPNSQNTNSKLTLMETCAFFRFFPF